MVVFFSLSISKIQYLNFIYKFEKLHRFWRSIESDCTLLFRIQTKGKQLLALGTLWLEARRYALYYYGLSPARI